MYMKVLLFCCKGFEMMEFSFFYDVCGFTKAVLPSTQCFLEK